ncbi:PREDICTED: uncharacterized protein LOC18598219 [Theobroma cacao]|uniref:Uncharacterized protein LOC18598219 n=1 Tax=Theobroma cacao TaxID=3641 RepID=A0AB32WCZ2_THECC|nr:PREDICTED: uncharacterized protein LOC18598219 [Theobroma cacao]
MASAVKEEISKHGGSSSRTQSLAEMEDEEEELFEINLEAVNSIPPPHYWEAFFTATRSALLANCLLPISDLSSAIPTVSTACSTLSREGLANIVMVGESLPGKLFGIPCFEAFGVQHKEMRA